MRADVEHSSQACLVLTDYHFARAHLLTVCMLAQNRHTQSILRVLVVAGVGMIMGDGVLTPAISVVSACEGLQQASANITRCELPQAPFAVPPMARSHS